MDRATPLTELARLIGAELHGDGDRVIRGVAGIDEAGPDQITFLANAKYRAALAATRAGAVILDRPIDGLGAAQVVTPDPYYAYSRLVRHFYAEPYRSSGVSSQAAVAAGARLGRDVSIHAFVVVEDGAVIGDRVTLHAGVFVGRDSRVGDDSILYPNVTVREGVALGRRVILHSGAVIGSDGFGFATHNGRHEKILQVGSVVIEDDVELGANVTVDRAALGVTRIGRGTKVDNLVQIAHNVSIGEHCLIVAQVGISGSTTVGNSVTIAGQAGAAGHVTIGDGTVVAGRAGVTKDIPPRSVVSGFPAMPHDEWRASQAAVARLPELRKRLRELEQRLARLEGGNNREEER